MCRYKKKTKFFILAVSNSECNNCCQSEPLLKKTHDEFKTGNWLYKGKSIQIARVDMATDKDIFERESVLFEQVPKITFFK